MSNASEAVITQARSGDPAAFIELARHYEPALRKLAESKAGPASADVIMLGALAEAFRAMPAFTGRAPELETWMAGFLERAVAVGADCEGELWSQLAAKLAALAPALAAPEIPERRFPVVPSLRSRPFSSQRRRG